jgi:rod shape-determining protein MreD
MPWSVFAAALLAAFVLQTTVIRLLGVSSLDLLCVLALLCGLLAPTADARIAGWIIGLVQDLGSAQGLGPHAFALGLTAWLLTRLRAWLSVRPVGVRLLACLLAAWPGQFLLLLHAHTLRAGGPLELGSWMLSATMTATWSAVAAVLLTTLPWLAIRKRRRSRPAG